MSLVALVSALAIAGCAANGSAEPDLVAAHQAFSERQYDRVISESDKYIAQHPGERGAAEALYLKGRAIEDKPSASAAEAHAKLLQAHQAYADALNLQPTGLLEAHIHSGLANTSFWLDDYNGAQREWKAAYDLLDNDDERATTLYHLGQAQQRLGQWEAADASFAMVREQFSSTEAAALVKAKLGARAFTVQFATFAGEANANAALTDLKKQGVNATRTFNERRQLVITSAPVPTYQQAVALKQRLLQKFPDAMILP